MGVSIEEFIIATLWMHGQPRGQRGIYSHSKDTRCEVVLTGEREAKSWQYLASFSGILCTQVN